MGQEQSAVGDDVPPQTLSQRSLAAVAALIRDGRSRQIVVLTGAGISTAAGIPDFRSPDTGLYHNLQRLDLPFAEAVFDINYFRSNPKPFYVLAKELYPGRFHPTISHAFIALLADKGLLRMLFTQNIDCLERRAGVPDHLIVEAHGSFATQRCIGCGTPFPDDDMRRHVEEGEVPRCGDCNGLVKPDITFFGEQLPQRFHDNHHIPQGADLVLILGTSLTVHPFASLPGIVPDSVPRVLFNLEQVGGIGSRADDVLALGSCDAGIRQFADELGWRNELEARWRSIVGDEEADRQLATAAEVEREGKDKAIEEEATKVTDEVDRDLRLDEEASADAGDSHLRVEAGGSAATLDYLEKMIKHMALEDTTFEEMRFEEMTLGEMTLEETTPEGTTPKETAPDPSEHKHQQHPIPSSTSRQESTTGSGLAGPEGPRSESEPRPKPGLQSANVSPESLTKAPGQPPLKDVTTSTAGSTSSGSPHSSSEPERPIESGNKPPESANM